MSKKTHLVYGDREGIIGYTAMKLLIPVMKTKGKFMKKIFLLFVSLSAPFVFQSTFAIGAQIRPTKPKPTVPAVGCGACAGSCAGTCNSCVGCPGGKAKVFNTINCKDSTAGNCTNAAVTNSIE